MGGVAPSPPKFGDRGDASTPRTAITPRTPFWGGMLCCQQGASEVREVVTWTKEWGKVCCLAWCLSPAEAAMSDLARAEQRLAEFHDALRGLAEQVKATIIEETGTQGMLMLSLSEDWNPHLKSEDDPRAWSMEDNALKLGQIIGEWALEQDGPFGVRIGMHVGLIKRLPKTLADGRYGYIGDAVTSAKSLALSAPEERHVHLAEVTKSGLNVFECLTFLTNPSEGSYYLEPGTRLEVTLEDNHNNTARRSTSLLEWSEKDVPQGLFPRAVKMSNMLVQHGVDPRKFPHGAMDELVHEVDDEGSSALVITERGELQRQCKLVKLLISVNILTVEYVLVCESVRKDGALVDAKTGKPITMRIGFDASWESEWCKVIVRRLHLDVDFVKDNMAADSRSHRILKEVAYSNSYPGLKTLYTIHEVKIVVSSQGVEDSTLGLIGLPHVGSFDRVNFSKGTTTSTRWVWRPKREMMGSSSGGGTSFGRNLSKKWTIYTIPTTDSIVEDPDPKRKLVAPEPLQLGAGVSAATSQCIVQDLMKGKNADWARAQQAATKIRAPSYSCGDFYEDCVAAFPELALYVSDGSGVTVSGNTPDEEYQRTMGALFAVYWLMRVDMDGPNSFCFGVSDDWTPLTAASKQPCRTSDEIEKRKLALANIDWAKLQKVVSDAGLLIVDAKNKIVGHDVERTLAMLALTSFHDIMKIGALTPTIQKQHGTFCGFTAGEKIGDHDIALAYVLECFPSALPSYAKLPKVQANAVRFTQSKMEYNMGWLVQAEAPPGAIFKKFKEIIKAGGAKPNDVAFYFTHWLTDLAGAEPCPQEGCEKFVLKFPHSLLVSFLDSISIAKNLATKTETQVYEDYLHSRWTTHVPALPPVPKGAGSIAQMRLVVMGQGDSKRILEAYDGLPTYVKEILDEELARTGCRGQAYDRDPKSFEGPAFLVYYGPALMQKAGADDPSGALTILSSVYANARQIFPLSPERADESVTIRIDAIKNLSVNEILKPNTPGDIWVLEKTSNLDASIHVVPAREAGKVDWSACSTLFLSTQRMQQSFKRTMTRSPGSFTLS